MANETMTAPAPGAHADDRRDMREILVSIDRSLKSQKKGVLERLSMVATLLTPLLIGGGGLWVNTRVEAAKVEEQRIARVQAAENKELQVIQPFIPYIFGDDEERKQAAIEMIHQLGNARLAAYAASIRPSTGSARALQAISAAPGLDPGDKQTLQQALRSLPDSVLQSLTPVPAARPAGG